MPKLYFNMQQNSVEWFKAHSTIPTASRFSDILTPKKMEMSAARKKYACQIIAARLLNWQPVSLDKIEHIEHGRQNEPFAVAQLELIRGVDTKKVGFITTNDGRFGASPDRVVMSGDSVAITVECKCPSPPVQMEYLMAEELAGMAPKTDVVVEYRCQRQGQLFIAEADEAIFYSYHPQMPACYTRDNRDEPFIRKLAGALERFSDELEALMERAKLLGAYQALEEMRTPAEAEHAENLHRRSAGDDEMDGILGMAEALRYDDEDMPF